jgi:hypothetical protein
MPEKPLRSPIEKSVVFQPVNESIVEISFSVSGKTCDMTFDRNLIVERDRLNGPMVGNE